MPNTDITAIVRDFVQQVTAAVEATAVARIQAALGSAFRVPARRGPGRTIAVARKPRPKQLCPVPGCTNPAAPVFGMVCSKHKDLPRAQIKKYRRQRKAQAAKAAADEVPAARKAPKASPKLARARRLQGQYLGALKSLNAADKAKVKAVAKTKGVGEAVKLAVSLKKPKARTA